MKNAKLTILIVIIVLVIGAISFYIWNEFQDRNSGIDEKMAVSIPLKENPAAREPKAIVKVEKKLPPMPDLNKPIKITAKIDDKAKKEAIEIINNLRKDLK